MGRPELWLVAGPNGAGKTTIVQQEPIQSLLPHVITLNPDDRSLKILQSAGFNSFASAPKAILKQTFIRAANEIFAEAASELAKGRAICLETVWAGSLCTLIVFGSSTILAPIRRFHRCCSQRVAMAPAQFFGRMQYRLLRKR